MTWFRVDDNLAFHAKTVAAGLAAMGLWLRAGSWCAGMLTDGFVPDHMIPALSDGTPELAERLVAVGFWRRARNGYQFHEWIERNPTADTVKEHRRKEAERKAEWRARKAATRENEKECPEDVPPGQERPSRRDNGVRPEGTKASVPPSVRSYPTRPDPTHVSTSGCVGEGGSGGECASSPPRKRAGRLPEPFRITDAMTVWAREHTPHIDPHAETERFRDYWTAKSGKDATKHDWVATWRNWMRKAEESAPRNNRMATADQRVLDAQALKAKFADRPIELPWGNAK